MARQTNKLNARAVATVATPGRHGDGGGLYLQVAKGGSKSWLFLYRRDGKLREMGLGGLSAVPLARARQLAADCRADLAEGRDPIEARRHREIEGRRVPSFGEFADGLVDDIAGGFRNAKHVDQWRMTLREYCAPIRSKTVDAIGADDVLEVLKPIWLTKAETASRLRGRIERVLDAAKAKGHRTGENPARWRGHLDALLPARQKLQRGHHAAMPYAAVPGFVQRLKTVDGISAMALEFLILTASRSGEVRGATWGEIDTAAKVWTIPAGRMKAGKEHRVPLTLRCLEILKKVRTLRVTEKADAFIFPGLHKDKPLSVMAFDMALRRLKVEGATVHGFRSAFRDYCGEETAFPREIAEAALAHTVGDAVERAYRRGDALEKRRALMLAWANHVEGTKPKNVAPLRAQQ